MSDEPKRPTRRQCEHILADLQAHVCPDIYTRLSLPRKQRVEGLIAGLLGLELVAAPPGTTRGYAVGKLLREGLPS